MRFMRVIWVLEGFERTLYGFCKGFVGKQGFPVSAYLGRDYGDTGNI